jgi:hypothetical protein
MPQLVEATEPDDHLEEQRELIRQLLDAIANDIGMAMRDAGLDFPIFLTVPASGSALATVGCPLDPSDEDWSCASAIACHAISNKIGGPRLRGRPLPCAMVKSQMATADSTNE